MAGWSHVRGNRYSAQGPSDVSSGTTCVPGLTWQQRSLRENAIMHDPGACGGIGEMRRCSSAVAQQAYLSVKIRSGGGGCELNVEKHFGTVYSPVSQLHSLGTQSNHSVCYSPR